MKKLVGKISLFDDGSYLWEEEGQKAPNPNPIITEGSAQTLQILSVIEKCLKNLKQEKQLNPLIIRSVFTSVVKSVSVEFGVSSATVYDKLGRKLKLKVNDWVERLIPQLVNDEFEEVARLLQKTAVKASDLLLIQEFFDKLRNENEVKEI